MMKLYFRKNLTRNKFFKYTIVLLAAGCVFELSTSFILAKSDDDITVVDIDSTPNRIKISELYFRNYSRDSGILSSLGYNPYDVPSYSDAVFSKRIKELKSNIPLCYNKFVRDYINLYLYRKRPLVAKVIGRSYDYFPLFEEALKKKSMPEDLKNLAIVESALNLEAKSWCGAMGIWQFMPSTAKLYKLQIDSICDQRKDPKLSTEAAVEYLEDLHNIYKDWLLAIAAYNCGPGNINKAMKKARRYSRRKKVDFWAIKRFLPAETQGYVPAFIASCYMMKHYNDHNLKALNPAYLTDEVKPVELKESIAFEEISKRLKITPEELAYFNPSYEKDLLVQVKDTLVPLQLPVKLHVDFHRYENDIYQSSLPKVQEFTAKQ